MIKKISIHNYKSIQSLEDFELKPVNILIGANNSSRVIFGCIRLLTRHIVG
jgi:AAA15 family ATPase/GTPase